MCVIHFEIHFGEVEGQLLTPPHQYAYSPYCPLNISKGADKENLFTNQEFLFKVCKVCKVCSVFNDQFPYSRDLNV